MKLKLNEFSIDHYADNSIQITLESNYLLVSKQTAAPLHVTHNRIDTAFTEVPEKGSFNVQVGTKYQIVVQAESTGTIQSKIGLVEYLDDSRRVVFGGCTELSYTPSFGASTVSLFLRIEGIGEYVLKSAQVIKLYRQEAVDFQPLDTDITSQAVKSDDFELNDNRFFHVNEQVFTYDLRGTSKITVKLSAFSTIPGVRNAALLLFKYFDKQHVECLPSAKLDVSAVYGNIVLVETGRQSMPADTILSVSVPPNAATLELSYLHWKKNIQIWVTQPNVNFDSVPHSVVVNNNYSECPHNLLDIIDKNDRLVVFYKTTAVQDGNDWDNARLFKLASEYDSSAVVVVFCSADESSFYANKLRLGGAKIVWLKNEAFSDFVTHAAKRRGPNNIFVCCTSPDVNAFTAIERFNSCDWITVYDMDLEMEALHRRTSSSTYHSYLESSLIKSVKKIVTVTTILAEKAYVFGADKRKVKVISNAASEELTSITKGDLTGPFLRHTESADIVGYIGDLNPQWFDWELLVETASQWPEVHFEIIGRGAPEGLMLPLNVSLLGSQNFNDCVRISGRWKVGLIPYKRTDFTAGLDPAMVYEYLAMGLRVVASDMEALREYPATYIYRNNIEFSECLLHSLTEPLDARVLKETDCFLKNAYWSVRARQFSGFIEG